MNHTAPALALQVSVSVSQALRRLWTLVLRAHEEIFLTSITILGTMAWISIVSAVCIFWLKVNLFLSLTFPGLAAALTFFRMRRELLKLAEATQMLTAKQSAFSDQQWAIKTIVDSIDAGWKQIVRVVTRAIAPSIRLGKTCRLSHTLSAEDRERYSTIFNRIEKKGRRRRRMAIILLALAVLAVWSGLSVGTKLGDAMFGLQKPVSSAQAQEHQPADASKPSAQPKKDANKKQDSKGQSQRNANVRAASSPLSKSSRD